MKTIIIKNNQVVGFDAPQIDPMATRAVIEPLLMDNQITKQIDEISRGIMEKRVRKDVLKKQLRLALKRNQPEKLTVIIAEMAVIDDYVETKRRDAALLTKELKEMKISLLLEKAQYFHPKSGEYIIDDDVMIDIKQTIKDTPDGSWLKVVAKPDGKQYIISCDYVLIEEKIKNEDPKGSLSLTDPPGALSITDQGGDLSIKKESI